MVENRHLDAPQRFIFLPLLERSDLNQESNVALDAYRMDRTEHLDTSTLDYSASTRALDRGCGD